MALDWEKFDKIRKEKFTVRKSVFLGTGKNVWI
jgi:hypothetical protein